jgi:TonB family protein
MGYQALLFCPDERLVRVVSQVFTELDFTIEHVHEPFAAVKRLMAQRYDAVVVDCENETNAALLFKSARNSTSNQSSLAIAIVEGQAGVAKAYRIGANLVLTKPINVEQAKGTLRVARGLLRKTAETVASPAPPAAPVPPSALEKPRSVAPAAPLANKSALPEFEAPLPAMTASAKVEESPVAPAAREVQAKPPVTAPPVEIQPRTASEPAKPQPALVMAHATEVPAVSPATTQGAAAAPAPARQAPAEKTTVEFEAAYAKESSAPTFGSAAGAGAPSFAALDDDHTGGSGSSKKILIGAAAVLALAALGYLGWSTLGARKTKVTSPAVTEPQAPPQQSTPPTGAPMSAPLTGPTAGTTNRAGANSPPGISKAALESASAGSSSVTRIQLAPEAETLSVAPIVVKSTAAKQTPARADEAAPLPSPLAVGASDDADLSNLTMPATRHQPSLVKLNISQGVSQGLLIKRVQPKYPQNALAMHIHGTVELEAMIDKEGKIVNLTVVKGDPVLARAALDAVHQWRYKPYYLDGVPVDIETQITVNFKLPN